LTLPRDDRTAGTDVLEQEPIWQPLRRRVVVAPGQHGDDQIELGDDVDSLLAVAGGRVALESPPKPVGHIAV
jgi:hypothetical protein